MKYRITIVQTRADNSTSHLVLATSWVMDCLTWRAWRW